MPDIVAADIGGTHARFAMAEVQAGRVTSLSEATTLKTAEHITLAAAWGAFAEVSGLRLPPAAAIAVAAPVHSGPVKLTNSSWLIDPARLREELGVERAALVNDFGAVAHAVAQLDEPYFRHLCGPDIPLPRNGTISVVGPGTGLGVAQLLRREGGYEVVETEGGHAHFAPVNVFEDDLLARLRARHGRVSIERVVCGQGLASIYALVAEESRLEPPFADETALWSAGLSGKDDLAAEALDRFCRALGSAAGDIALVQGARAVVIAGGLGLRLLEQLPRSGFRDRFVGKGRFERMMDGIPVKIIAHPQPGLFGAAAAFARQFEA